MDLLRRVGQYLNNMSSQDEKILNTMSKLLGHFVKEPENVGETVQFLSIPDVARFFKQLHHSDSRIRKVSLQILIYILMGNHERKRQLMRELQLDEGVIIFNSFDVSKTSHRDQNPNQIFQRINEWADTLNTPQQKFEVQNSFRMQSSIFSKCGVYCYKTGDIFRFSSAIEQHGEVDPADYLVFGNAEMAGESLRKSQVQQHSSMNQQKSAKMLNMSLGLQLKYVSKNRNV